MKVPAILSVLVAFVLSLFASATAFAGGKLTLKPKYDLDEHNVEWVLGLPVYQRILPAFAYNSWTGFGVKPDHDENWLKTEQGVETYFQGLAVGLGVSYEYTPATQESQKMIYSNLSVTLW